MAFYGGYSSAYPSSYTPLQSSLAGYGGTYRVNQPAYYGPSYSSTSETDYPWFNQPAAAAYGSSYNAGLTNGYGLGSSYYSDPFTSYTPHYTTSYQPQVVSAMPSSSQRSHSGTGSQSNLRRSESNSDDLTQLAPQIEAAYEAASGQRRQSVVKRQVITIPGQPGRVQQVVRRLPTPTPDVIERVFIVKPQRDTVNLIIERPNTPPAQYKDKTVYGKQRRPLINPKIIQVPSRNATSSYYQYYPYCNSYPYSAPYNTMQALTMQQPTSTTSSYQFQPQQPAMSQASQHQYAHQPTMSQGNSSHSQSQSHLSDSSQARLSERLSQNQLNQPQQQQQQQQQQQPQQQQAPKQKSAYIVAPVKYEESPQPSQPLSYPGTPIMPPLSTSPLSYPSYGGYSSGFGGMQSYYPSTPVYPTTPYGTRIY